MTLLPGEAFIPVADLHSVDPVAVDLVLTGEIVGHICRTCMEPCTPAGRHLAPPIKTVRYRR